MWLSAARAKWEPPTLWIFLLLQLHLWFQLEKEFCFPVLVWLGWVHPGNSATTAYFVSIALYLQSLSCHVKEQILQVPGVGMQITQRPLCLLESLINSTKLKLKKCMWMVWRITYICIDTLFFLIKEIIKSGKRTVIILGGKFAEGSRERCPAKVKRVTVLPI